MKKLVFPLLLIIGTSSFSREIPITKVILYKNGISYIERKGRVRDNEIINLSFKDEISDILKSLTIRDLDGGKVFWIDYESKKPLDKILEDFSLNPLNDNLTSLLDKIKGAELDIALGGDVLNGRLLGLRKKAILKDNFKIELDVLDIIDENGGLKSILLDDIDEIRLKEKSIEDELNRALETIFQYRKKERKNLSLIAKGNGERNIIISYITEAPVWKSSYRIVAFEEKHSLFLQGWAIVDNLSDYNWNDVSLSLVSGKPISFISDLYSPIYKKRPVIKFEEEEVQKPTISERTFAGERKKAMVGGFAAIEVHDMALEMKETQEIEIATREMGDLFEYKIDYPVSIPSNKSALIPIIEGDIKGERLSLYNEANNPKNPLCCLSIENTTNLTLDKGPITVFENEAYAGEGILDRLRPTEKAFITYGVDLGVSVSPSVNSERRNVHYVSIIQGTMYAYYKNIELKTYSLQNNTLNQKEVIIEHPLRQGWDLKEPEKEMIYEQTPSYYRFRMNLSPNGSSSLCVKEEMTYYETYLLTNITKENIEVFVNMNYISPEIKGTFEKIIKLKDKINEIQKKIASQEKRYSEIFKDQERIRENLKVLKDTPTEKKLAEEYVNKLSNQEKELEALKKEIEGLYLDKESYTNELNNIIKNINFEKNI